MRVRSAFLTILLLIPGLLLAKGGLDAKASYESVKKDLKAGRHAEALATCEQALREPLDDVTRWGFLIGAGLAAQKLGRAEEALEHLERFLAEHHERGAKAGPEWQKRREGVQRQADLLEQGLLSDKGRVTFDSSPAGATVTLDGEPAGTRGPATTPFTVFLAAGRHALRLERQGFSAAELDVTVAAGRRDTIHVPLVAAPKPAPIVTPLPAPAPAPKAEAPKPAPVIAQPTPEPPAPSPSTPVDPAPRAESGATRLPPLWGWIAVGTGGVLALSGIPFTIMAVNASNAAGDVGGANADEHKALYDAKVADMRRDQALSWVFYGVGAAAAIGGATYLTIAALRERDTTSRAENEPSGLQPGFVPLDGGGIVTVGGRW